LFPYSNERKLSGASGYFASNIRQIGTLKDTKQRLVEKRYTKTFSIFFLNKI